MESVSRQKSQSRKGRHHSRILSFRYTREDKKQQQQQQQTQKKTQQQQQQQQRNKDEHSQFPRTTFTIKHKGLIKFITSISVDFFLRKEEKKIL
jgi:type IV secretory pathway VirB10-like protein